MTMDGAGPDSPYPPTDCALAAHELDGPGPVVEVTEPTDGHSLEELITQLEQDPQQCRQACEGLELLDVETRLNVIKGLASIPVGSGVIRLLHLLANSECTKTRAAAIEAQKTLEVRLAAAPRVSSHDEEPAGESVARQASGAVERVPAGYRELVPAADPVQPRLINCLVTAVDGLGRGSVVISANRQTERCTAMFLCDVERGITGTTGLVEPESGTAGSLLEDASTEAGSMAIEGVPELALGLLGGCLAVGGDSTARPVLEWLEATLGRGFKPRPFPMPAIEPNLEPTGSADLLQRARTTFLRRAQPGWTGRRSPSRWPRKCLYEKVAWPSIPSAIPGFSGSSSSTGSFIGWNSTVECCSGCTGSGAVPGRPSWPDQPRSWPGNSLTSNLPCPLIPSPWR